LQPNYSHRTIISFYLILVYSSLILKPVLPIVNDSLSHVFALAKHLATVHAVYGANHVQLEIVETNKPGEKSKTQNPYRAGDSVPLHIFTEVCCFGLQKGLMTVHLPSLSDSITWIYLPFEAPPPKRIFYPIA
jgi:hypothetical protein